jgi:hypothetical protein
MAEKPDKRRLETVSIVAGASGLLAFHLAKALVEKGLLSQSEAAGAFVAAANDVRSGTEDDHEMSARAGETMATTIEQYASWLLENFSTD